MHCTRVKLFATEIIKLACEIIGRRVLQFSTFPS
jgi:hypothetical protein